MRKYLKIIAILLPVFAMTLVSLDLSFAVEGGEQVAVATEGGEQVSVLEFLGTVVSIDTENSILVAENLKEAGSTESQESVQATFSINENTAIEKDSIEAVLGDLTAGDNIKAQYNVDSNGQNVAVSVSAAKANLTTAN